MRAFVISLVLLVVVAVGASVGLNLLPHSAQDVFIQKSNVRL